MATVLFICAKNETRSPMAEAIFNSLTKKHNAISAGVEPNHKNVSYYIVKLCKEIGVKIGHKKPQKLTKSMLRKADKVVILCDPKLVKGVKGEYWKISSLNYKSWEYKRKTRDLIKSKVENLIKELG